jgi:hypothetical protein
MWRIIYGSPVLAFFAVLLMLAAQTKWIETYLANMAPAMADNSAPAVTSLRVGLGSAEPFPSNNLVKFATAPRYLLQNKVFGATP